jgi:hypothetical protein
MVPGIVCLVGLLHTAQVQAGCVGPLDVESIYRRTIPNDRLGIDQRALKAFAEIYQYRLNRFYGDGVWQLAKPWQRQFRFAKERFDAIEQAADGAAPAPNLAVILLSYANIPPEARLEKTPAGILANWVDKSGNSAQRIIRSPAEIGAKVLGIAPESFERFLDDLVSKGPPPGYRGICAPTTALIHPVF